MAENTEIGKAYLNIVPSMDGFAARLSQAVNQQSGSVGDQAGELLGSGLVGTLTKYLSAAAIGLTIRQAFLEGADLQQSLGGVETLFKDSADQIKEYAYDAFKTAGLSANEYMTQATSTSAALIKSLSGDTQRAAELTQISITDMSDNVNKFGGDVESLQRAYQGFSRENFTMLDNLRLGYSGNREGMEQLLADAEKLSGIHYDISSYADMIEAIHVIQENLDITGTTAREASETFSGSFNAMQSAAKNLGGVLTAGGDVGKAVKDLEDTSLTFGKNVLSMTENVADGIFKGNDALKTAAVTIGTFGVSLKVLSVLSASTFATTALSIDMVIGKLVAMGINAELAFKKFTAAGGWYAVAIAAAAAAAKLVANQIDKMTDAIDEAYDPAEHLGEKFKEISRSASDAAKKISEITNDFESNISDIDRENAGYSEMTARLGELSKVKKRTNEEEAEFKAIVEALNKKYPALGLEIDKNTGKLNKNLSVINKTTDALSKQEKAEEAKTKLAELYAARNDAEEAYNTALENRNALIAVNADMTSDAAAAVNAAYISAANSLRVVNGEIEKANTLIAESDAAEKSNEKFQAYLNDRQNAIKAVTSELKDYVIAVGDSTYNISSETYDKIKTISDGYAGLVQNQENVILGSLDLFSQFSAGTDLSFAELDSNLDSNQQAFIEWRDGIETLEGTDGISEGLINELKSMGVGSLEQVRALVKATPDELKRYSDKWDETYTLIHQTAEEQLEKNAEENAEQIRNLVSQTKKGRPELTDAYAILASAAPEGYGRNLSENTAEISRVTAEMVSRGIVQKMQEMHTDAYNSGWNTVTAAKQGMIDAAEEPFTLPDLTTNPFSTGSVFSGGSSVSTMRSADFNNAAQSISAAPISGKMEVKIVTPDGREVAEWLIDDIDELSAVKLQMGR